MCLRSRKIDKVRGSDQRNRWVGERSVLSKKKKGIEGEKQKNGRIYTQIITEIGSVSIERPSNSRKERWMDSGDEMDETKRKKRKGYSEESRKWRVDRRTDGRTDGRTNITPSPRTKSMSIFRRATWISIE